MGQPTPPGDAPLYEGLGAEWNDIVSGFPEDKRAQFAPLLKSKLDQAVNKYEPLKQWEDLTSKGISRQHVDTAVSLYNIIENNPREVYDTLGKHLGLTAAEVKEAVEEAEETGAISEDPRIQTMQEQIDTLAQIALAQRQQTTAEKQAADQDAAVENEMSALKKKYGETAVDEEEVLMRMLHKGMTAEQAFQEYSGKVNGILQRRPAPMLMGAGGVIPRNSIDVKKMNPQDTKNYVAQMLQQANAERNG